MPAKKVIASNDRVATPELIESTKRDLPGYPQWAESVGGDHSQFGMYGHHLSDDRASIDSGEQQHRLLEQLPAVFESR